MAPASKNFEVPGTHKYKYNFLDPKVTDSLQHLELSSLVCLQTMLLLERDGLKTTVFESPGFGASNFFMPLKYHGDGEVDQHGPAAK